MKRRAVCLLVVAALLLMLCVGPLAAAGAAESGAAPQFTDIQNHWAESYIVNFAARGYIEGYPDKTFRPDKTISRAEFTCILINCLGAVLSSTPVQSFSDTSTHWAHVQIDEAVRRGILIVSEYPNGLKPDNPILRSEAAAMMVRALNKSPDATPTSFKDQNEIALSMYRGYIKEASNEGLMHGYPDGTFLPFNTVTRATACVMLTNLLTALGNPLPASGSANTNTSTPGVPGQTAGLVLQGTRYDLANPTVYIKQSGANVPIIALSVSGNTAYFNNNLGFSLNSTSGNPDLVVNNTRYVNCQLSSSGSDLAGAPASVRLDSLDYGGHIYDADYVSLYIGNAASKYNLSDAELVDQQTVRIAGTSYNLGTTPIAVSLNGSFYAIQGISRGSGGASLDLVATAPVVVNGLSFSDIAAIFINSQPENMSEVSTLFFVINGTRYDLSNVIIDASGNFSANNTTYPSSQVVMVINGTFYNIQSADSLNGKFIFYCTASSVATWARINNQYRDASGVQLVMGSNVYNLASVIVVSHDTVRLGGQQYTIINSGITCQIDGVDYDIEDIDWDNTLKLVTMDTGGSPTGGSPTVGASLQPHKYDFYVNNTLYQDGATGAVTIYAGGGWQSFNSISMTDASHFTYNNTAYNLIGSQVRIGGVQFVVSDSAWRVSSGILEVYLAAA